MGARFPQGKRHEFPMRHCSGARKLSNLISSNLITAISEHPHCTRSCSRHIYTCSDKHNMFKPYTRFQSQGHVQKKEKRKKRPNNVASLILVAFLVVEIIQHRICAFADPLRPCIKVKVIEVSTSRYVMCTSTVMPSLDNIAYILSD